MPGGVLLTVLLKSAFQRGRPIFDDPLLVLTTSRLPSGHAMAATVLWGCHSRSQMIRPLLALPTLRRYLWACAPRTNIVSPYLVPLVLRSHMDYAYSRHVPHSRRGAHAPLAPLGYVV